MAEKNEDKTGVKKSKNDSLKTETFADRVEKAKNDGKKRAFKKREEQTQNRGLSFSEVEYKIGSRMLPLLTSSAYKALEEFENFNIADSMAKAFDPPNPAWCPQEATIGEKMMFKKGFNIGVQVLRLARQNLMTKVLEEQSRQSLEKQEGK